MKEKTNIAIEKTTGREWTCDDTGVNYFEVLTKDGDYKFFDKALYKIVATREGLFVEDIC